MTESIRSRRHFLTGATGVIGASLVSAHWPSVVAAHSHATDMASAQQPSVPEFFTAEEARVVEAITAQVIPTDDTPGAREAGAVHFIDRSLRTWATSSADAFRAGLGEFNARFATMHAGGGFHSASSQAQIAFLEQVDATPFFETIRFLTLLGMFALPSYGGNSGGAGWKLMGFEDLHAFSPPFGYYDRDYPGFEMPKAES